MYRLTPKEISKSHGPHGLAFPKFQVAIAIARGSSCLSFLNAHLYILMQKTILGLSPYSYIHATNCKHCNGQPLLEITPITFSESPCYVVGPYYLPYVEPYSLT